MKIINDPVYGFISINHPEVLQIIDHPWFQRLRRIKQLGMSHMVYPGACHNRFAHAIGATHLMQQAVIVLRQKGVEITSDEEKAAQLAILLHDIGHGPFSHSLEYHLTGVSHEFLSKLIMQKLNDLYGGILTNAIAIFENSYQKKFLHQLVSSQLDMDRLDYLRRDSFYTGVSEGIVGVNRIIKMLNVANDELVIEEKGIYSVEKFLVSRRLMYWQAYMHKTTVATEFLLGAILSRAKQLTQSGQALFATPSFHYFLQNEVTKEHFKENQICIEHFLSLDDVDVLASIKVWCNHSDFVLAKLCNAILNRKLFKIKIEANPIDESLVDKAKQKTLGLAGVTEENINFFFSTSTLSNSAYVPNHQALKILCKDGSVKPISEVADNESLQPLSKPVVKHYIIYPKEIGKI
ncbi:MAG: HD domain-containing protein [Luteibaculaceae bacterium]